MTRLFAWSCALMALLPLFAVMPTHADAVVPVRLAIVSQEADLAPAVDILTAAFSQNGGVALLERSQINKVIEEQGLAATTSNNKDFLKIGDILGADGLLILTLEDNGGQRVVLCRLVAVKPGVQLEVSEYNFPLSDPEDWGKLAVAHFAPLLQKLTVPRQQAVPVSILNLRSAITSPEGDALERELTLLFYNRLTSERNLFVLERRSMESLSFEKEEMPAPQDPFWNGSYLIEGTIDPHGFVSNQITVDVQITPPDKKNITSLEISGPRSNLTRVINDLAQRVAKVVGMETTSSQWSAEAEANRYFEEARWMLRWKMAEEAKAASDAAWALGRQTQEVAEMRMEARQTIAGSPGGCNIRDGEVHFYGGPHEGMKAVHDYHHFAFAPDPGQFPAIIQASEIWVDGTPRFFEPGKLDAKWCKSGLDNLEQSSWWLRYYYFTVEARNGNEDNLRHARALCREIFKTLGSRKDASVQGEFIKSVAKHVAFWTESPEETLSVYHGLVDKGYWPEVRSRFFNSVYRENVISIVGHGANDYADEASPCLAGWDWETRRHCPALWSNFIDSLCASDNPLTQMEGKYLRCSYAWSNADFKTWLADLERFIRSHIEAISLAETNNNVVDDLIILKDVRGGESHHMRGFYGADYADIVSGLDKARSQRQDADEARIRQEEEAKAEALAKPQLQAARAIVAEPDRKSQEQEDENQVALSHPSNSNEQFLLTDTNFDFKDIQRLLDQTYTPAAAKHLLPFVTNYSARVRKIDLNISRLGNNGNFENTLAAHRAVGQIIYFSFKLERKLRDIIAGPQKASETTRSPQMAPQFMQHEPYFHPIATSPYRGALLQNGVPKPEPVAGPITSARFCRLPDTEVTKVDSSLGNLVGMNYRDGKLWLLETYQSLTHSGFGDFFGVNLDTFETQHIAYTGDQYELLFQRPQTGFDVDAGFLYFQPKESVHRYSFASKSWDQLLYAQDSRPQRLGNRLFLTSDNSIQEYFPDGSFKLLASCRRRPAENDLDKLPCYKDTHLFVGEQGTVNFLAGCELYELSVSGDWQHVASIPDHGRGGLILLENGFIKQAGSDWWGMFGVIRKPQILFANSELHAGQPFAGWRGDPPGERAAADDDSLWFIPASINWPGRPYVRTAETGPPKTLMVVRYKYNDPWPMRFSLDLKVPEDSARPAPTRLRALKAVPEGLVVTRERVTGFWLISRDAFDQAAAHFNQQRAASQIGSSHQ